MINIIKNLFCVSSKVDYKELIKNGAQIIDVRTPEEYALGHIEGSINIPLNELTVKLSKIKKNVPVITCCASGIRSSSAKSTLLSLGFTNIYNGGGWISLKNKV
jgi:rhodanese-related sulfurtransferase